MTDIYQLKLALSILEGQLHEEKRIARRWASREAEAREHKETANMLVHKYERKIDALLQIIYS